MAETTFGDFQRSFSRYFTRQTTLDPNLAPGELIKPLHSEWTVGVPPEKTHLMMESMNSRLINNTELVPEELIPYVSGKYVPGHMKPDQGPATYKSAPGSFTVVAKLIFANGVLTQLALVGCKE